MKTSGTRLWWILWKAYGTLRECAERNIHSLGLCYSDFAVLEVVLHKGPTAVNTIGDRVGLTSGSITAAVDRLASKGLVERRPHAADRRARVVHLTAAGRKLARTAFAEHEAAMERAAAGLTDAERGAAVDLLKKLGLAAQAMLEGEK